MDRWIKGYIYGRDGGFIPGGLNDDSDRDWANGFRAGQAAYLNSGCRVIDSPGLVKMEATMKAAIIYSPDGIN